MEQLGEAGIENPGYAAETMRFSTSWINKFVLVNR